MLYKHKFKVLTVLLALGLIFCFYKPTLVRAEINSIEKMSFKEILTNRYFEKNSQDLKLEIDMDKLREIVSERKRQEEIQRQIEEEKMRALEEERRREEEARIVFDGLNMSGLSDKLNRFLNSSLAGTGEIFAKYAVELGIDPYMAVSIVLLETGCNWQCSGLLQTCNNVGGMKGAGGCGGGDYAYFPSLDEGIRAFMFNLKHNYYDYGLTTPEAINPKYAESTTWAENVRSYMNKISAN